MLEPSKILCCVHTYVWQVCVLTELADLCLANNNIRTISPDIQLLSGLTRLQLQENLLNQLPKYVLWALTRKLAVTSVSILQRDGLPPSTFERGR